MQRIETRTTDSGHKVNTYFDTKTTNYPQEIMEQRKIAIAEGIVDSQEDYRIGYKDIQTVKSIVDESGRGLDGTELAREILFSGKHREYLAQWFKGRGSFYAHFSAVLRMLEQIAPEVAKLTGYTLTEQHPAWVLAKGK